MGEDEREALVYRLLDELKASIGTVTDDQKMFFIAGARSALHLVSTVLDHQLAGDVAKLKEVTAMASNPVRDNLQVVHASRMSALQDLSSALTADKREVT